MTFREHACQKCIQAFKGFESILEKAYLAGQFISDFFIEIHFKHFFFFNVHISKIPLGTYGVPILLWPSLWKSLLHVMELIQTSSANDHD